MKKLAVVIGRFAPLHMGHAHLLQHATNVADEVMVFIGSRGRAPDLHTPWSAHDRLRMVQLQMMALPHKDKVTCRMVRDYPYDDAKWARQITLEVNAFKGKQEVVFVCGLKDQWMADLLPKNWRMSVPKPGRYDGVSGTMVREAMFGQKLNGEPMSKNSIDLLLRLSLHNNVRLVTEENAHLSLKMSLAYGNKCESTARWGSGPHLATDAVVTHGKEVLTVLRKDNRQLALPGGYLEPGLTLIANAAKELREETGLDLPLHMFKPAMIADQVHRSARSRIVSHVYRVQLKGKKPTVVGGDDAADAGWLLVADLLDENEGKMSRFHDDHFHILENVLR